MKNIFGGCFGAFRVVDNRHFHDYKAITTIAEEDRAEEASKYFFTLSHLNYPEGEGWYGHYGSAVIVPESQINDFLESR